MSLITVFGSINVDLVAGVDVIPRPGETVLATGYTTLCGGKGANQAVAAAHRRPIVLSGACRLAHVPVHERLVLITDSMSWS